MMKMVMKYTIQNIFCKYIFLLYLFLIVVCLLQHFPFQKDDNLYALLYPKTGITYEILPTLPASVAKVLSADPPLTLPASVCKETTA